MTLRIGYDGCLVKRANFGVGRCILRLAEALALQRTERELFVYAGDPEPWSDERGPQSEPAFRLIAAPRLTRWRGPRILWQQLSLPRRAASDRLDLFHATGYTMPIAMGIPTVLTVFDLLAFTHPDFCRPENRWHYKVLTPTSLRRARRVIVPSSTVRNQILERFDISSESVVIVPPGIDEVFRRVPSASALAAVRTRYRLPEKFVLFAGNLEPKKNVERLIAAFRSARDEGLEGELLLAGGKGWGTGIDPKRLRGSVRSLGFVPDQDLAVLYRLASEFAFPSLAEGLGLPVLEAMASGTTVVSSLVASVEDSDPEAVVLVDPLSVKSIAHGLLRARADRVLRGRLRQRGLRAASRFTWERAAAQTWAVYQEVLRA